MAGHGEIAVRRLALALACLRVPILTPVLFLAASGCDMSRPGTSPSDTPLPQRTRTVARQIGLPLPPGAQPIFAWYQTGLDDNARLILSMSTTDWDTMRSRPPLNAIAVDRYSTENLYELHPNEGEWDPESYPGLVAAQAPNRGDPILNVGFVKTARGQVRVYVFWYRT